MLRHAFLSAAIVALAAAITLVPTLANARPQWTPSQATTWYARQPWPVGSNYIPADAINQFEMWQPDTFNPKQIDWELGLAESTGMTTMRVFLQDQLWTADPAGFKQRIDAFLVIAARHHIKPLFVLFDSCWDAHPHLGKQKDPVPGLHNSGWVQSPGIDELSDPTTYPKLKAYVTGVIGAFAKDDRILGWDVWNEPSEKSDDGVHTGAATGLVANLLPQVFAWARSADPTQPLTSGVFDGGDWSPQSEVALNPIQKTQLDQSDLISFHSYSWPEEFANRIRQLQGYNRPIFCTEYMARGAGSTIDTSLPLGKTYNIAMYNWGFVDGKTQTKYPWDSYAHPYTDRQPTVWFHDLFHADGTPYRQREIDIIRSLTGKSAPQ